MTLATPTWLWLLTLLPVVLLLHTRRRRKVTVGSVVIWRRLATAADVSRRRWQRPLSTLPLLLQLAFVVLAALGLARPQLTSQVVTHHIYLLDASASMQAVENDDSRFGSALGWLQTGLRSIPGRDLVTIVRVGPWPEVVVIAKPARAVGATTISGLEGTDGEADWIAALSLAMPASQLGSIRRLTVLTDDHGLATAQATAIELGLGDERAQYVTFGGSIKNLGIASIGVHPAGNREWSMELSGEIASSGSSQPVTEITVAFEPGGTTGFLPWAVQELRLSRTGRTPFAVPLKLPGPGRLRASLPGNETYANDDVVIVPVTGSTRNPRVLRVGVEDPALDRALTAIDGLELFTADQIPSDTTGFDLVVVNGIHSPVLPATSTLWFGSAPPGTVEAGTMITPKVTSWSSDHEIARGVDWSALEVDSALALPPLPGARTLVASNRDPLVQARTTELGRQIVVSFLPSDSNWQAQVGFPAFIAAVVDWSRLGYSSPPEWNCRAGSICALPPAAFSGAWRLTEPDGEVKDWPYIPPSTESSPFSQAWPESLLELAFRPERAGTYVFESDRFSMLLPVLADPAGIEIDANGPSSLSVDEMSGTVIDAKAAESRSAGASALRQPWKALAVIAAILATADMLLSKTARVSRAVVRLKPRAWARRASMLGLSALTLACLFAAVIEIGFPWFDRATGVVVIVDDRGASSQAAFSQDRASESLAVLAPLATVRILGSSHSSAVEGPDRDGSTADLGGPGSNDALSIGVTDPVTALEVGRALVAGAKAPVILVQATKATLLAPERLALQIDELSRSNLTLAIGEVEHRSADPLVITSLAIPTGARAGDVVGLQVQVASNSRRTGNITVSLGDSDPITTSVAFEVGTSLLSIPIGLVDPGSIGIDVRVSDSERPEVADSLSTIIDVGAVPRVLVISSEASVGAAMRKALALQGIDVRVEPPLNLPWDTSGWTDIDVAVLMNVPAVELHSIQQEAMASWVRDGGGGLLVLGGENTFGPGGYFQTALEEISPLSSQVPQDAPEVTMLFVVDRSGSMQQAVGSVTRMDIAKDATRSAIELLGPQSQVGIVVYDTVAEVLVPVQSVENKSAIEEALDGVRANGGTFLIPALEAAVKMLEGVASAAIHVVVLTDGMSQPGDFATIIGELRSAGATISMVGIGDGADRSQLVELARLGGGAFHLTSDVKALPSILAQEALMLSDDLVKETETEVLNVGAQTPILAGVTKLPAVMGYVTTAAKPGASLHLALADDELSPLLASWRYGLGRVLAFTSHGAGTWVEQWMALPDYPRLWGQAVRWAVRNVVGTGLTVMTHPEQLAIDIDAFVLDGQGLRVPGARLTARLATDLNDWSAPSRLLEVTAGHHVGTLYTAEAGTYEVVVESDDSTYDAVRSHIYVPGLPEYVAAIAAGNDLSGYSGSLASLARVTRGEASRLQLALNRVSRFATWSWSHDSSLWLVLATAAFLGLLVIRYIPYLTLHRLRR